VEATDCGVLKLAGAMPVDGGEPIIVAGKLIGAIGISGGSSDQNGQAARTGAQAIK
jgi:glc operon protein GlcG